MAEPVVPVVGGDVPGDPAPAKKKRGPGRPRRGEGNNDFEIRLLPKQHEFVLSQEREVGYSGAYGAGKTRALCLRLVIRASVRGALEGLFRSTRVALVGTTLQTLLEGDGDLPPVLPAGTYKHHKTESRIDIANGGTILYAGLEDEFRVRSMNLSGAAIDEATELTPSQYEAVDGRVRRRFRLPDGRENVRSTYWASNPDSPVHHLYSRFQIDLGSGVRVAGASSPDEGVAVIRRHLIMTSALDNTFLPADYIAKLNQLQGWERDRYRDGRWTASEGLVYPEFRPDVHLVHRPAYEFKHFVGGVDWGFTNPSVLRVHGVDGDGRSHVVAELYRSGVVSREFVENCRAAALQWNPLTFIVDPSAADLIQQLRNAGMDVRAGDNDVTRGIRAVQDAFRVAVDGKPRFTMEPGLPGNREYYTYRWNPETISEQPIKKDDHACDADRYARMAIDLGIGGVYRLGVVRHGVETYDSIRGDAGKASGGVREVTDEAYDRRLWPGARW